ncbi:MAG: DUF4349 domain-containing protein [Ruminococcaceae bacterium]|nr:DUF4349 domain-containing protein [Oscillospiraceae bacterium]
MKFRKVIPWLLCLVLLLGLTGCSTANESTRDNAVSDGYISKEESSGTGESATNLPTNRKLIQTVYMSVETENLDTVLQQIDDRIAQLGGYIESSNVQNGSAYSGRRYRNASITVRIPAEKLDAFLDRVGEVTNIVSSQKTVEDVTLNYVATESRMKALQAEEARLLELIGKAESLEDLLTLDKRLTEVRTELEKVTSALKLLENQVDYATIYLSISEVKEFTDVTEPETVWERISVGFAESLEGVGMVFEELFVFAVVVLPYLVVLAIIPVTVIVILRIKKRKKGKTTKEEKNP